MLFFFPFLLIHIVAGEGGGEYVWLHARIISWPSRPGIFHDCVLVLNISTRNQSLHMGSHLDKCNQHESIGYVVIKEDENQPNDHPHRP